MTSVCIGIGINAGVGVAIGDGYVITHGQLAPTLSWAEDTDQEIERFQRALQKAAAQLREIRAEIPTGTPAEIVDFIDTHLLMMQDKLIAEGTVDLIRESNFSAEWALQVKRNALITVFEEMDDPYLRTRRDDLDHVVNGIQKVLAQDQQEHGELTGRIVVADDLTPAEVILMQQNGIAGFITEHGGPLSHTAILARSLGLPAIVGAHGATICLLSGEEILLDAATGVALSQFDGATREHFEAKREKRQQDFEALRQLRKSPATTRDGRTLSVQANIELPQDLPAALENGAEGIGLYRTEFLYMNRTDVPSEEEHFESYREVVIGMTGRPVTIRTLDLGADKQVDSPCGVSSSNPALGLRAIRLCLKEPELFRPQLRAILRASALGPVRLMLPMLTNVWEAMQARALIEDVMRDLTREQIPFDPHMSVGGMIEVPAAALAADSFAKHLDFLSIGTNDLVQYTLAIDRIDDEVSYLFDPVHTAVLQLIERSIAAAARRGIPISMCGEMAGDPRFIPLLVGMGLGELSMHPGSMLDAKRIIRKLDAASLKRQVEALMANPDQDDPYLVIRNFDCGT